MVTNANSRRELSKLVQKKQLQLVCFMNKHKDQVGYASAGFLSVIFLYQNGLGNTYKKGSCAES